MYCLSAVLRDIMIAKMADKMNVLHFIISFINISPSIVYNGKTMLYTCLREI